MSTDKLRRKVRKLKAKVDGGTDTANRCPSPAEFRKSLLIDADGQAVPFKPDPWQEIDFRALDPAWQQLAGLPVTGRVVNAAFLTRPRGHSKTGDTACMVAYALAYATRPIKGICAAADQEQAGFLRDAIATLARLNPALECLEIQNWLVTNKATGAQLKIISSSALTSFGHLVDFVCVEELTHWGEENGKLLWTSLYSAVAKRRSCLLLIICNAGFTEHFAFGIAESFRTDPDAYFSHLDGPKASWITPDRLEKQRQKLPPLAFDRLWLNQWSTGSGDALQSTDIDAALTLSGPPDNWDGFSMFSGLDLGISRDHAALVTVGKHNRSGRLRLARVLAWIPPGKGVKIDLTLVEKAILDLHQLFHPHVIADPYQAEFMVQTLIKKGVIIETVPFVGATLVELASGLIEVISSRQLELYQDAALLADLRRLRIVEGPAGWKLAAARTSAGHCDRATALSLAVLGARRAPVYCGGEIVTDNPRNSLLHHSNVPRGVFNEDAQVYGGDDEDDEDLDRLGGNEATLLFRAPRGWL